VQERSRDQEGPHRNLVEEDCYRDRLRELKLSHAVLDEIFVELAPAVCRCPQIYYGVDGIHRIRVAAGVDHPELRIWFEYDDENVYLIDIECTNGGR
jgi:hypothetical protein